MQSIEQECHELLCILLHKTFKLTNLFTHNTLK